MNSNFDFNFWKIEFRDRFELNRTASEMLNSFMYHNPKAAKDFIINTYQRQVYKCDIIDKYCEKYDSEKINSILKQIEFDELTEEEIQDYGIKVSEEAEESEEL